MALGKYEGRKIHLSLNGRVVAEATSFEFTLQSGDNAVMTLLDGFAGFSDGAEQISGTINGVVPKSGYTQDYYDAVRQKKEFRLAFTHGGRRRQAEGRLTEFGGEHSVSATATNKMSFMGKPMNSLVG